MRPTQHPFLDFFAPTEDVLIGDELGNIYYYVVEWPSAFDVSRDGWHGTTTKVASISVHTQQICALSWTPNGYGFISGANDNLACYVEIERILKQRMQHPSERDNHSREGSNTLHQGTLSKRRNGSRRTWMRDSMESYVYGTYPVTKFGPDGETRNATLDPEDDVIPVRRGQEKHCWKHDAAVKAIAFCPWQDNLVATGGGSNDKCIHFWHVGSEALLATIVVSAQVTSLIWSTTRPEIAATFGYPTPDHPYRVAVFSWPSCKQVGAIAWSGGPRALSAIPYPKGPADAPKGSRTAREGTIIVASSDRSIKFHEIWPEGSKATFGGFGMLGGSDILEGLDGIEKEGDVIR
ncbi:Meiosis-specific APC/C activator protein AMA1 [Colletotrichum sidae]|uniref:Meiosis-specific APC/C activator protein AMA1 n=1 Tax=Colletotrichum sidae TaxID=1347389 RepID=A0A4R8T2M6_9PEZI|nr:Meiosis-specific APC/C activator protein AMA1 [Colletotrichum sidae]